MCLINHLPPQRYLSRTNLWAGQPTVSTLLVVIHHFVVTCTSYCCVTDSDTDKLLIFHLINRSEKFFQICYVFFAHSTLQWSLFQRSLIVGYCPDNEVDCDYDFYLFIVCSCRYLRHFDSILGVQTHHNFGKNFLIYGQNLLPLFVEKQLLFPSSGI